MTYNEAKSEVAKRHGLGTTLVTGHKAGYFEEAMELYVESLKKERDEFVAWLFDNGWEKYKGLDRWKNDSDIVFGGVIRTKKYKLEPQTTKELFVIFKSETK